MARVEEPGRNVFRLVGRGREESTPAYFHLGVLIVVGLVFLAQALT